MKRQNNTKKLCEPKVHASFSPPRHPQTQFCHLVVVIIIRLVSPYVSSGELCACDAVVHVLDVFTLTLKVGHCVIGARDKDLGRKTQSRAL